MSAIKIGWLSSGRGEGSYGLLKAVVDAIQVGKINGKIQFIFCNRELGEAAGSDRFIHFANGLGVPVITLSSKRFKKQHSNTDWGNLRKEYDLQVWGMLKPFSTDNSFTVGAGYMLIAPLLCEKLLMLNLHPALPDGPKGTWKQVVNELADTYASESGVMIHITTKDVDLGPVVSFCRFSIRDSNIKHLWQAKKTTELTNFIRSSGLVRERVLMVETLADIAKANITLTRAHNNLPKDMTSQVETALNQQSYI